MGRVVSRFHKSRSQNSSRLSSTWFSVQRAQAFFSPQISFENRTRRQPVAVRLETHIAFETLHSPPSKYQSLQAERCAPSTWWGICPVRKPNTGMLECSGEPPGVGIREARPRLARREVLKGRAAWRQCCQHYLVSVEVARRRMDREPSRHNLPRSPSGLLDDAALLAVSYIESQQLG
ncbi:hypothetical protein C8F01DRAFT_674931 [Mycena amicta]|nr:hypothetical protein C8F01DRAFT_674931 [Mycena amicta]